MNLSEGNITGILDGTSRSEVGLHTAIKIMLVICASISGYIAVALTTYEVREGFKNDDDSSSSDGFLRRINQLMRAVCLLCALVTFYQMSAQIALQFKLISSLLACNIFFISISSGGSVHYSCVYTILFLRQTSIYNTPAFQHLIFNGGKILGILTLAVLVLVQITIAIFVAISQTRGYMNSYCAVIAVEETLSKLPLLFQSFTLILAQIILLALFVVPLVKYVKSTCEVMKKSAGSKRCISMIKSVTVLSIICIVSDFSTYALAAIFKTNEATRRFHVGAFAISMALNLISVVMVFNNWKKRLFPWVL